ncbi:MAG TPA: hypothetical protein VFV05_01365 [Methylomirabilota bacterium]|nr:hypothetical protein [Methylomirabilota bacterium]
MSSLSIGFVLVVLAVTLPGEASAKAARVGFLGVGSAEASPFFEELRQGLRDRGWIEGQNITFENRTTVAQLSRLSEAAAELARLKVDIIVTWGTTAALAAMQGNAHDSYRRHNGE